MSHRFAWGWASTPGRSWWADVGAARRREYTAIGDAVNVAARIEELTKEQGAPILVSEETRRQVGGALRFSPAGAARLRGRSESVQTYVPDATIVAGARVYS